MTALLWCDKMYKNISKKLLHLTIEFFGLGFTPNRYFVYASYTSGPELDADR